MDVHLEKVLLPAGTLDSTSDNCGCLSALAKHEDVQACMKPEVWFSPIRASRETTSSPQNKKKKPKMACRQADSSSVCFSVTYRFRNSVAN
ncbi:hypothetical protein GUJ93_ZPchr0007g5386 [Zizania palustris]|uniref:Uncharacterized protein n=1 Tax=Zizania palustris TaxID=103762 RepID=A0A8J5TB64_ZIZPA|nr:hypothetical protein GUJ93_ZPchr0007g5386 [Zizania palustris]